MNVPSFLNNKWTVAAAGLAVIGASLFSGSKMNEETPDPATQHIRDQIHELTYKIVDHTQDEAGATFPYKLYGYQPESGAKAAIELIQKAYDDEQSALEALEFLHENDVVLHATSMGFGEDIRAVFYNNSAEGDRVLVLRHQGEWDITHLNGSEPFPDELRQLIDDMRSGDVFNQNGAHIIFRNEFSKEEPFTDRKFFAGVFDVSTADPLLVLDGAENTEIDTWKPAWNNPLKDFTPE